jgi:hypothetical protein
MSEHESNSGSAARRLSVFKTYKLYIGGKFPRSESGRVYEVSDAKGKWLANAPLSSRKDARDAVVAARKAFGAWSGATAYNRGQILYRVAEMLEGRRAQFVREVADAEGLSKSKAAYQVDATIDRWVWYAGWTDKIAQVVGGGNPVAGPYFNLSSPEPTGVVAVLAASGVPGGVGNILSGGTAEVAAPLAAHQDVNAIDLAGADDVLAKELEIAAADNLKRVLRPQPVDDWSATPGIDRMTAFLETKTVWHPTGSLGASGSSYSALPGAPDQAPARAPSGARGTARPATDGMHRPDSPRFPDAPDEHVRARGRNPKSDHSDTHGIRAGMCAPRATRRLGGSRVMPHTGLS